MGHAAAAKVLALLFLVNGAMSLAGALNPLDEDTPVGLLEVLAAVGLVGGLALLVVRHRAGSAMLHVGVAVLGLGIALLTWRSATRVGVVGLGPALVCLGLYAAYFLPLRQARAHVGVALALSSLGATFSVAPDVPAQAWVVTIVAVALVTEVQGRLIGSLTAAASTDSLTGLLNRRAWLDSTDRTVAAAERRGHSGPAVVIIDLDDFKQVNDRHGHAGGDRLLRELTTAWSARLRRSDVLARYGGDEFALLLSDGSDVEALLQRMRAAHEGRWTAGVARWRSGDTTDSLLLRADDELYERKHRRRDADPVVDGPTTSASPARTAV
jgi:diguanylate cyclase (GGDEF)-like protein